MRDAYRHWIITDFDRLNGGLSGTRADAEAKAEAMALAYPGNTIHVLESVCAFEAADKATVERCDALKDFPAR